MPLLSLSAALSEATGVVAGVSLPVGLNVVLAAGRGHSRSPFTPLLDLGVLFSYHLSGTSADDQGERATVAVTPNAGVQDVFPPGLFLAWGLGDSPMALSFGVQIMPTLRDVTRASGELVEGTALRAGISLALDLPLLNLSWARGGRLDFQP